MIVPHRPINACWWLAGIACCVFVGSGCNQNPADTKNAAGKPAKPAQAEPPTPAPATGQPDTPAHPAVASKVDGQDPAIEAPAEQPTPDAVAPDAVDPPAPPAAAGDKPIAIPTPPPGALPEVALSAAHRATCKLVIGDALPPLTLPDLKGGTASLESLFGQRVTVVAFLQGDDAETLEVLSDLAPLVTSPYGNRGVRAVAIHVGEPAEATKNLAAQNENGFATLIDADGTALSQVTDNPQGLMPRIFLVDATGKILWFDIEYSRTTRRDLDRVLRYLTRK
jgi:peroxiredoxin